MNEVTKSEEERNAKKNQRIIYIYILFIYSKEDRSKNEKKKRYSLKKKKDMFLEATKRESST